jgi:hypothetical protein
MKQTVERLAGVLARKSRATAGTAPQGPNGVAPAGVASQRAARVPNWAGEDEETPARRAEQRLRQRVEDAISDAQARGEFDNLRGKGKPIPAELLVTGNDAWLAGKALSNAGFLPPWLQLQQEIDADLAECRRLVERTERFPPLANRELPLAELRTRLDGIRAKTRRYNLMAPTMSLQRPLPDSKDLVQRMARAVGLATEA